MSRSFLRLLLKSIQHQHHFRQGGLVYYTKRAARFPDSDLSNVGTDNRQRFPIIRLFALLDAPDLISGATPRVIREIADDTVSVPEKYGDLFVLHQIPAPAAAYINSDMSCNL